MAYKLNAIGPLNLAKAAADNHAVLFHVSTDFVFDGSKNVPYTEEEYTSPSGVYGETKLQGEKNVLKELRNSYIIRTSWLYSNYGNNFVKTMIRLGTEKEELGVIFDQAGTPTYAADLASALMQMLVENSNGAKKYGIYHYSNEGVASWYDFTKAIHEIWNIKCKVNPIKTKDFPTPAKRPHYSVMDKTKIKTNFSIEIPHWREALLKCHEVSILLK
jgi:dTDP-4-dehydrorhamnose reductase